MHNLIYKLLSLHHVRTYCFRCAKAGVYRIFLGEDAPEPVTFCSKACFQVWYNGATQQRPTNALPFSALPYNGTNVVPSWTGTITTLPPSHPGQ